jgi:Domain of Unknown Function (DUF1080)
MKLFRSRAVLTMLTAGTALFAAPLAAQSKLSEWPQQSEDRPKPRIVEPGAPYTIAPPSDAVVLFDGTSLDKWASANGAPAKWRVENGAFVVVPGTGTLTTKDSFGDVQLHIEWAAPNPPVGKGQDRGNSGVFFGGDRYEIQVLDSRDNATYADGQAGSIYGQFPPLVNPMRAAGEWQVYDIVYHRPRFKPDGTLQSAARFTVFVNGVLVQDNMEPVGPTSYMKRTPYSAHPDRLPITLQDHSHPVRYRNVWLRNLE